MKLTLAIIYALVMVKIVLGFIREQWGKNQ